MQRELFATTQRLRLPQRVTRWSPFQGLLFVKNQRILGGAEMFVLSSSELLHAGA